MKNRVRFVAQALIAVGVAVAGCGPEVTGGDADGAVTADAGMDREVLEGERVTLEGMGNGAEFSWAQVSGPLVTLEGSDQAMVSFDAPWMLDESLDLEFELTVRDGVQSTTDTVLVTVASKHFSIFNFLFTGLSS